MKIKHILLAVTVLVSVATFAQKDELKKLRKIYEKDEIKSQDLSEYIATVNNLMPLATEEGDKIYANFYKAMIPVLQTNTIEKTLPPDQLQAAYLKLVSPKAISDMGAALNATLDFEKKSGKKIYTDDISETVTSLKSVLFNMAIALVDTKQDKQASEVLHGIYLLDPKDQDKLFFAASYSVNAQDFDKALEYYYELKRLKYTGEGTLYFAYNIATKKEDSFGANKTLRDIAIKTTSHNAAREEKIPAKTGEIYKNIALILIEKGRTEEALLAVSEARIANPNDSGLILTEANLYLKLNDIPNYTKLVNEVLANDPNNADLLYNLAVISANANKPIEAEDYYKKALLINPVYFNALLNLSELKLRSDEKYVIEMNKLGTTEKDNKRYEVIKSERENNFKSILPYLEKAVEIKPEDEAAKKTLISVYNALEMTDKAKALKAKQ